MAMHDVQAGSSSMLLKEGVRAVILGTDVMQSLQI